jgi:microsomal dipeptidase-like Zn-dependent dipeptidase
MAAEAAEIVGVDHLGIGSDLCQKQPDSVVRWMRAGRWTRAKDDAVAFPQQPDWFRSNEDFPGLAHGLAAAGLRSTDIASVLGGAWRNFISISF